MIAITITIAIKTAGGGDGARGRPLPPFIQATPTIYAVNTASFTLFNFFLILLLL